MKNLMKHFKKYLRSHLMSGARGGGPMLTAIWWCCIGSYGAFLPSGCKTSENVWNFVFQHFTFIVKFRMKSNLNLARNLPKSG